MSRERKGLILAVVQVLLICSLGGKLLLDRHRYPRVWVKTASYDPEHIVRGRYVSLSLEVPFESNFELTAEERQEREDMREKYPQMRPINVWRRARLEVRDGRLIAVADDESPESGEVTVDPSDPSKVIWRDPVEYYIPEHAQDPSMLVRGTSLWAEVTIPKKGPPRPIQLATSGPGGWHVLELR